MASDRRYESLSRDEAVTLLKKRLMIVGGLLGLLMGIIWIVIATLAIPGFPQPPGAPFFTFLFFSLLLLGAAGAWGGRRVWRKNVAEGDRRSAP